MPKKRLGFCLLSLLFLSFMIQGRTHAEKQEEWSVQIKIPAFAMLVFHNGIEWARFPIAVGKPETPTPEGYFVIVNKLKNPTWYPAKRKPVPPGPNNPLGKYWLGLSKKGYGIHGNNNPSSIGYPVSNGCIRLRNQDVKALFSVLPKGTPVLIRYEISEIETRPNQIPYLTVFQDIYRRYSDPWPAILFQIRETCPDFPLHEDGLRWLLGKKRPNTVQLPRRIKLEVDGEIMNMAGFIWENNIYLPGRLSEELWGHATGKTQFYTQFNNFCQDYSGCFQIKYDEDKSTIQISTIRVLYNERLTSIRARWKSEPVIDLCSLMEALNLHQQGYLASDGGVWEESSIFAGRTWIPISKLSEIYPYLRVSWKPEEWRIDIYH
jgi:hypothetical protein